MKQANLSMRRLAGSVLGCSVLAALLRGRRRRYLALPLSLIAFTQPGLAQLPANLFAADPPSAPSPQLPAQIAPTVLTGTIAGTLTDPDGTFIAGASITLIRDPQTPAADPAASVAISTPDGRFAFPDVPPGPFKLSVAAPGFAPQQTSGELHPGESCELAVIALLPGSTTSIDVTASQTQIAEAQINQEEKQRVIGFFPNFYVSYLSDPVSLDPKQKFELAFKTLYDPVSFVLNGVTAGVQQAANTYSWGQGAQGYGKRYAAAYGTFLTGTLIGSAALPILFKQDPRYFYKGTGTVRSRVFYALANAVVCKGDNHHWQPAYSAILGGLAAGGISNFYYPADNRAGIGLTLEGAAIGTGFSAITNLLQEFLVRKLTPHIPPHAPTN